MKGDAFSRVERKVRCLVWMSGISLVLTAVLFVTVVILGHQL